MAAVEIAGLRFGYSDAEAILDGICLSLAAGEAHAILGGSGAGKTTLLNLLAGLLRPDAGSIRFDGRDVTDLGGAERNVAQVFQFPVLYPSLSVADNIGFALGNRGWKKNAVRGRVGEVAALLDIVPLLGKRPGMLSLFEKQLVAIARALARPDVAVVLLDEPLTAVEPAIKWRLRRALKTVQRELGLTMVYVTHDQGEALTFADRITMLHRGGILQTGSPLELYEAPAHTEVAGFIGSPGMNLVAAEARDGLLRIGEWDVAAGDWPDGPYEVGFRPEWARIRRLSKGIPVAVAAVRVLGTEEGVPVGLVTGRFGGGVIHVRQRLDGLNFDDVAGCVTADGGQTEAISASIPQTASDLRNRGGGRHEAASASTSLETGSLRVETDRFVVYRNDRLVFHAGKY